MKRVLAIVGKDIKQISRNRFMAVITFLSVFAFAAIFHILPKNIDEQFRIALYFEKHQDVIEEQLEEEDEQGLEIKWADSQAQVKRLVKNKKVEAGFSFTFPDDEEPRVRLFISSETPEEIREAGEVIGREFAFALVGRQMPVDVKETVIGPDRVGDQIPVRNRLRIFFIIMVLLVETFSLANLLVDEIMLKTIKALLVTPVNIFEFLTAKSITGISLAFLEGMLAALLLLLITPETIWTILIFIFLGAVLVTGLAFIIGALSHDMFSIIGWGMLVYLTLAIPGISLIFPGATSPLMKVIPTYHLVQAFDGTVNLGISLGEFVPEIIYLILFDAFFFVAGLAILKRRLA